VSRFFVARISKKNQRDDFVMFCASGRRDTEPGDFGEPPIIRQLFSSENSEAQLITGCQASAER
jgi:hypothetical protein